MPMWARSIGKALVWVLVLLAPVQPVLALDCTCCCKIESSVIKQPSCQQAVCNHHEHASCNHRHAEQPPAAPAVQNTDDLTSAQIAERRFSGCRPCNCPQDCGCHLRHATRLGILSVPAARVNKDLCGVPVGHVSLFVSLPIQEQRTDTHPKNFCRETSALAICALLCRFAS